MTTTPMIYLGVQCPTTAMLGESGSNVIWNAIGLTKGGGVYSVGPLLMGSLHYDGFNVNWIDDMAILVTVIVAYNKTQWYQSWVTVDNVVMIEDYFGDCVLTSVLCLNNCWWLPINFGVDWRLYLWLIVACDELFAAGFVSCWWQQQDTAKWPDHSLVGLAAVKCHQQHESAGSWHCLPWSGEWCFLVVLFPFDVILIH